MTRIKCCGMFREKDIAAVNQAHPDFCGFIVGVPASHRNVTLETLARLHALLDTNIPSVGVFVNADPHLIADLYAKGLIDIAQLHGTEDAAYIQELRALTQQIALERTTGFFGCSTVGADRLSKQPQGIALIQAFKVQTAADVLRAEKSCADMVLLDAGQGSGQSFNWKLTQHLKRPFMLAGGLTPENLPVAIAQVHPWGVDLSSGLETDKLKDPYKIQAAVQAVHAIKDEQQIQ